MKKIIFLLLPFLFCFYIFYKSVSPPSPMLFHGFDKLAHYFIYLIISIIFFFFHRDFLEIRTKENIILTLVFVSIFGAFTEFSQTFVPFRDADILDFLSDFLGALTAITIISIRKNQ